MFTGIIEEIGEVKTFSKSLHGAYITICCRTILDDIKCGDSIAINGVCQTVTDFTSDTFSAKISDETLSVTTFADIKQGNKVNLERALTLKSRLGGHLVSGHVDCKGRLISIENLDEFYNLGFEIPSVKEKYIVKKGSITVNGISLTIADICRNTFKTAIIPHTFNETNLKILKIGDYVNIETDILGKYVEKLLSAKDNNSSNISMKFLQENGFL